MSTDPIDQALRDEPQITPSAGFSARVMRSVRREADRRQALPFPWKPLAAGVAVSAALALAGALTGEAPPQVPAPEGLTYLAPALAWLSTALVASLGSAWWSVRFAGR